MRPGFGPAAELPTASPAWRRHGGCSSPVVAPQLLGGNRRAAQSSARGTGRTAYTKDVSPTEWEDGKRRDDWRDAQRIRDGRGVLTKERGQTIRPLRGEGRHFPKRKSTNHGCSSNVTSCAALVVRVPQIADRPRVASDRH